MLISQFFIIILTVSLSDANIIHISREINVQTMYNTAGICSIAAEFVSAPPLSCESMVNRPFFRSLVVRGLRLYMLELRCVSLVRFLFTLAGKFRRELARVTTILCRLSLRCYFAIKAVCPRRLHPSSSPTSSECSALFSIN